MSNKTINEALKDVFLELGGNPSELSDNQTISDYIEDLGGAIEDAASGAAEDIIDDTEASTSKTYSSNKINSLTAPELPTVTGSDNGKLLGVTEGAWGIVNAPSAGVEVEYVDIDSSYKLKNGLKAQDVSAKFYDGKYVILRQMNVSDNGATLYYPTSWQHNMGGMIEIMYADFISISFNASTGKVIYNRLILNEIDQTTCTNTSYTISYDA